MKLKFITIFLFSFGCCATNKPFFQDTIIESKEIDTIRGLNPYYVSSIYLMDSTYIIKVSRNDSLFKIVSYLVEPLFLPPWLKKERPPCERLQEGKWCDLEIHSIFEIHDKKLYPFVSFGQHDGNRLFNGISFDKESHYDIYYSKNLRGICYLRNDSLLAKLNLIPAP